MAMMYRRQGVKWSERDRAEFEFRVTAFRTLWRALGRTVHCRHERFIRAVVLSARPIPESAWPLLLAWFRSPVRTRPTCHARNFGKPGKRRDAAEAWAANWAKLGIDATPFDPDSETGPDDPDPDDLGMGV